MNQNKKTLKRRTNQWAYTFNQRNNYAYYTINHELNQTEQKRREHEYKEQTKPNIHNDILLKLTWLDDLA